MVPLSPSMKIVTKKKKKRERKRKITMGDSGHFESLKLREHFSFLALLLGKVFKIGGVLLHEGESSSISSFFIGQTGCLRSRRFVAYFLLLVIVFIIYQCRNRIFIMR